VIHSRTYRLLQIGLACSGLLLFSACDSFVNDTDPPIDSVEDAPLNTEVQVPFLIKGVQARFATTYGQAALYSGGLSDELVFDWEAAGNFIPSDEIEGAGGSTSNEVVIQLEADLGELRFFADNLLERIEQIEFSDSTLKTQAQFTGHFYGAIARYFYASYFGLGPRRECPCS